MLFWANPGNNTPWNTNCTTTYLPSHKPSKLDEFGALLEKQGQTHKRHSLMDSSIWTHQCWLNSKDCAYISLVWTLDAIYGTCQERWMIGMEGKRESGNSSLSTWLEDDIYEIFFIYVIYLKFILLYLWNVVERSFYIYLILILYLTNKNKISRAYVLHF